MKLLVFAHTPPPHHGQSYMVQLMLEGFGGDHRLHPDKATSPQGITCYHINARVSRDLEDIGDLHLSKFFLLLGYCFQAIWCRFRYGVTTMYYVPAPGKYTALYRDWLVMLLCRPFYKKIILHWHAAGLAKWLETKVQMRTRTITYHCMKNADLSVVLSRYNRADAEKLFPQQIRVVNNGIPDPCPNFEQDLLPRRQARTKARVKLITGEELTAADLQNTGGDPQVFKVLYLAHCTRDKGLFDSIEGVFLANRKLKEQGSPVSIELVVAGNFFNQEERAEFERTLNLPEAKGIVRYRGFVAGAEKEAVLREADCFCFPTHFRNENQPVNLIEAMAFGLPILTSRWRSIPELLPAGYERLVDVQRPDQVCDVLIACLTGESSESFREIFLRQFNLDQYLNTLAEAIHSVEPGDFPSAVPHAVVSQAKTR